jgi:hypothetical protein
MINMPSSNGDKEFKTLVEQDRELSTNHSYVVNIQTLVERGRELNNPIRRWLKLRNLS